MLKKRLIADGRFSAPLAEADTPASVARITAAPPLYESRRSGDLSESVSRRTASGFPPDRQLSLFPIQSAIGAHFANRTRSRRRLAATAAVLPRRRGLSRRSRYGCCAGPRDRIQSSAFPARPCSCIEATALADWRR